MPDTLGVDSERLLLDAAALRRRQLCAAFLHGSTRSWRIRRRIWPAAVAGILIVAIGIAALAVAAAFAQQQELDDQRQSQSIGWGMTGAAAPSSSEVLLDDRPSVRLDRERLRCRAATS